MAIGNQPTSAGLNSALGNCAVSLRDACQLVQALWEYANAEGAAGLQALGFTTGDATAFLTAAGYLNTVAGVYFGTASQGTDFNFDNALAVVRGGS